MRILGVDPGLATVGLGLIETDGIRDQTAIDWLTIETPKGLDFALRLKEIADDLRSYVREEKPDLAVVEKVFFSVNEKTALDVAQARGVILATLASEAIPVIEAGPAELKAAITGDGKADKRQMQDMLMHVLKLDEIPTPDDAADALALAVFGAIRGDLTPVR